MMFTVIAKSVETVLFLDKLRDCFEFSQQQTCATFTLAINNNSFVLFSLASRSYTPIGWAQHSINSYESTSTCTKHSFLTHVELHLRDQWCSICRCNFVLTKRACDATVMSSRQIADEEVCTAKTFQLSITRSWRVF